MDPMQGGRPQNDREWKLLEKLLMSVQDENRKQRRWSIIFRSLTFIYLFALLFMFLPGRTGVTPPPTGDYTAVVSINGVIADGAEANADAIVTGLRDAFDASGTRAVLLRINSRRCNPISSITKFVACVTSTRTSRCMRRLRMSAHPVLITSPRRPMKSMRILRVLSARLA